MKIAVVLIILFAEILASKVKVTLLKQPQTVKQDVKEVLLLEGAILRLFRNINQPEFYDDQMEVAVHYDIEENIDNYTNPQAVREFWDLNRLGFLPKSETFSIFNQKHRREAIALFKILYYAKDYATLYKTACWARIFMNGGLFVYSLSVALVQRSDTVMINLPPIYEVYPEYFYRNDVIREAQQLRQLHRDQTRVEEQIQPQLNKDASETQSRSYIMDNGRGFDMPLKRPIDDRFYRFPFQPESIYSPWYNFLPEVLRPMWMDPQYRSQELTPDELKQLDQIMQEQLKRRQFQSDVLQEQNQMDTKAFNGFTVDANYAQQDSATNGDATLSYFTEDIGLSAYYYYQNIYYPFWLSNEMVNFQTGRRGEQLYYMIQQLLARYYLERLSNNVGDITILDYLIPTISGYFPSMVYPNGKEFPARPKNMQLKIQRAMENTRFDNNYTNSYMFVRDYERRIRDSIDIGYITTSTGKQMNLYEERGFETLGNMIEGNVESANERFYGGLQIFARLLLGNAQPLLEDREYIITPSALEHFETSLRDPIFYQFLKRMVMYFQRYLSNISPYSTKELLMPGVKIENVEIVEPLVTFLENYFVDISNAVYNKDVGEDIRHIPVRAKQMRLNHKPFRFIMNINSDKAYNGLVKVFLGPKYDEVGRRLEITESRLNFVEIDKFVTKLTPGVNQIERSSLQNCYSSDRMTYREMYKRMLLDVNKPGLPKYEPREPEWCLPRRLLLPKGNDKGQMYRMYYIIVPYKPMKEQNISKSEGPLENNMVVMDNRSLGYPLDRPIDENDFYVPNSFFKDVQITHTGIKTDL